MGSRPALMTYGSAALLGLLAVVALGVPELRMWAVGLVVVGLCWLLLLPRGWFRGLDRRTRNVVFVFLIVRLLMPFIYIGIGSASDALFSGGFDSDGYANRGSRIAEELMVNGQATSQESIPGSGAIDLIVGYGFWLGSPDRTAAAFVFSAAATIGLLLFWQATRDLVGRRQWQYALTVLMLPTLLFWNSGIGKEAVLVLGTGATAMALHQIVGQGRVLRGLGYLALGVTLLGFVRPHIALMLVVTTGLGVALSSQRATPGKPSRRVVALLLASVAIAAVVPATLLLLDPSGERSLFDAAYETTERNAELYNPAAADAGRSAFATDTVRSPADIPEAIVTVLFRPFPWEVETPLQALAAAEASAMGIATLIVLWRVAVGRYRLSRNPQILSAVLFIIMFSAAFVSVGNFGLLVRQRMQVVGFVVFVLFALIASGDRSPTDQRRGVTTTESVGG